MSAALDPQLSEADALLLDLGSARATVTDLEHRALTLIAALEERTERLRRALNPAPPEAPAPPAPTKAAPGEVHAAVLELLMEDPLQTWTPKTVAAKLGMKPGSVGNALRALTKSGAIHESTDEGTEGAYQGALPATPEDLDSEAAS